jgi:hypothetical protein
MKRRQKQVRGNAVSFWLAEEGCGVVFAVSEDSEDEYFLMQRHFEEPDDGRPYIETDDPAFCGFFRPAATLRRGRLDVVYGAKAVTVTFAVSEEDFHGLARALRVLVPGVEVVSGDAERGRGGE